MSVVLTGVGTIGPWGLGLDELSRAWTEGDVALGEVERQEGVHHRASARYAGLVDHASYRDRLPGAAARRMSANSRMAVAATKMALEDAELDDVSGSETAVSFGTSFASTEFTVRLLRQIQEGGPQAASPFLFMETVANAYAGQIALAFDARGSNATVTQREASGLLIPNLSHEDNIGILAKPVLESFGKRSDVVPDFPLCHDGIGIGRIRVLDRFFNRDDSQPAPLIQNLG